MDMIRGYPFSNFNFIVASLYNSRMVSRPLPLQKLAANPPAVALLVAVAVQTVADMRFFRAEVFSARLFRPTQGIAPCRL